MISKSEHFQDIVCGWGSHTSTALEPYTDVLDKTRRHTRRHLGSGIIVYDHHLHRNFEIKYTSYIVDSGSESRFYFSEQVAVLFFVDICKPDGSKASDTFFNRAILSRVI